MRTLLIIICIGLIQVAHSQDIPVGEIQDTQIIIEKDKVLTLPPATKYFERPNLTPASRDSLDLDYQIGDYSLIPEALNLSFRQAAFVSRSNEEIYPGFLLADVGNYGAIHGGAGYTFSRDNYRLSLYGDHQSYLKGPGQSLAGNDNFPFQRTKLMAIPEWSNRDHTTQVSVPVSYTNQRYFYYGKFFAAKESTVPIIIPESSKDKVKANFFEVRPTIQLNPSDQVSINLTSEGSFFSLREEDMDAFNQELGVGLTGAFSYQFDKTWMLDLQSEISHRAYESMVNKDRTIFQLAPQVTYHTDDIQVKAGLRWAMGKDSVGGGFNNYLYPLVNARVILSDQLSVFGSLSGGLNTPALVDIVGQNRFLGDSLDLRNENERINIRAGIDFQMMPTLSMTPFIQHRLIENKYLFLEDFLNYDYQLVYERERFGQFDVGVNVKYAAEKTTASAELTFSGYQTETQQNAWNLPTAQLKLNAQHRLSDQWGINTYFMVLDGMTYLESNGEEATLATIADLGLGVDFQATSFLLFYVKGTNLLNQNYERYNHFPVRMLTAKAGLLYQF